IDGVAVWVGHSDAHSGSFLFALGRYRGNGKCLKSLWHTGERRISFPALVDSGADINVIPYSLGLALGLNWNDSRIGPTLTGKFANIETRLIVLPAVVGNFAPIDLVFTWMAQDTGPVILGQMNFFREFNVYFYGVESIFELERATP
uniref:hypothetical protein n=1 Tax=Armatimonas sp. TaxID=1872638 RepID=UPI00286BD019